MNRQWAVRVVPVLIIAIGALSCSTGKPESSWNEYFQPAQRVVTLSVDGMDTLSVLTKHQRFDMQDSSRLRLFKMVYEQNCRLDTVADQLTKIMQQPIAASADDTLDDPNAVHTMLTSEALLGAVHKQNKKFNSVIDKLKLLSRKQSAIDSARSVAVNTSQPNDQQPAEIHARPLSPRLVKQYKRAIQQYEQGHYQKAIHLLELLIKRHPQNPLADRCYFWIGVSQASMQSIPEAITTLTNVFSYPQSSKIESTYFMLGQCYEQAGMPAVARSMFQKMLEEYPQSSLRKVTEEKMAFLN